MPSKPVLIIAVVILTVIIAGIAIWTLGPTPQPQAPITPPTPTPVNTNTVTLGELTLCKDFQKAEGEISCEDALSIAKGKYSGTVQEISQGVFYKEETSPGIGIWTIEIKLDNPIVKNNNTFYNTRLFLRRDTGEEFRITRGAE